MSVIKVKVKVKKSHYRPGYALRVPGGWGSQISIQSAQEGGKVVSPRHRPPLPPENIAVRDWVSPRTIVQPEGLCQWKNPVTPSGIETATLRLVAECLNQLPHRVLPIILVMLNTNISVICLLHRLIVQKSCYLYLCCTLVTTWSISFCKHVTAKNNSVPYKKERKIHARPLIV
jgi:hypothetical protein